MLAKPPQEVFLLGTTIFQNGENLFPVFQTKQSNSRPSMYTVITFLEN